MKISYDYEELIQELKEELEDGILTLESTIQVLRSEQPLFDYYPIKDWYYEHEMMVSDYQSELSKEEYRLYLIDRPSLIALTVREVLEEMIEKNSIV